MPRCSRASPAPSGLSMAQPQDRAWYTADTHQRSTGWMRGCVVGGFLQSRRSCELEKIKLGKLECRTLCTRGLGGERDLG